VRQYLHVLHFSWRKPDAKPVLSQQDKKERLEWAQLYKDYDFSKVIYVDECTLYLDYSGAYCWLPPGFQPSQVELFPSKVNVWAAIGILGQVSISIYYENTESTTYIHNLEEELLPNIEEYGPDWKLMHDGAGYHTSHEVSNFLDDHMKKSFDPIKNLWALLKKKVGSRDPESIEELEEYVNEEF